MTKPQKGFTKKPNLDDVSDAARDEFMSGSVLQGPAGTIAAPKGEGWRARGHNKEGEAYYRIVNVKLTQANYRNLRLISAIDGASMQQIMSTLLDEYLAKNKHRLPSA